MNRARYRQKKALALCVNEGCTSPPEDGKARCRVHLDELNRWQIAHRYDKRHRDRTPTFEDFCRLEDER